MLRSILKKLDEEIGALAYETTFKGDKYEILSHIRNLIAASKNGEDADQLLSALSFIEGLSVKRGHGLFKKTIPFREILIKIPERVITPPFQQLPATKPLTRSLENLLGSIHVSLMDKIAWRYSYPLNAEGEVYDPAIMEWKKKLISEIKDDERDKAITDFKRDILIDGEALNLETDPKSKIFAFIDRSQYTETQKNLLKEWLPTHGGQELNRFISFLIKAGHYTDDLELKTDIGKTIACEQGWHMDNDGALYFKLGYSIKSLMYDGITHSIYKSKSGVVGIYDEPENDLQPLFHARAIIAIDFKADNLNLKIKEYTVTSYTDFLKSPSRLYLAPPEPQGSPIESIKELFRRGR